MPGAMIDGVYGPWTAPEYRPRIEMAPDANRWIPGHQSPPIEYELPGDVKPWYDRVLPGDQDSVADLLPGFLEPDGGDESWLMNIVDPLVPGDQDQGADFTIGLDDLNPFSSEFGWGDQEAKAAGGGGDAMIDLKGLIPLLVLGMLGGGAIGGGVEYAARRRSRRGRGRRR